METRLCIGLFSFSTFHISTFPLSSELLYFLVYKAENVAEQPSCLLLPFKGIPHWEMALLSKLSGNVINWVKCLVMDQWTVAKGMGLFWILMGTCRGYRGLYTHRHAIGKPRMLAIQGYSFKRRNAKPVFHSEGWSRHANWWPLCHLCGQRSSSSGPSSRPILRNLSSLECIFMESVTCPLQRVLMLPCLTGISLTFFPKEI